jgi:arylsulfatase
LRNNTAIEAKEPGYYMTDAFTDEAIRQIRSHVRDHSGKPFFQYLAYTAPHWPLHARPEDIAKYRGRFDRGWDALRRERLDRLMALGLVRPDCALSERDPAVKPWAETPDHEWQARRMEVYAAQVDRMDQGIGRVIGALKETGEFDNTLIVFLSDNGGCAEGLPEERAWWEERIRDEGIATLTTRDGRPVRFGNRPEISPGDESTYCSYGIEWANVSNTPFRLYKHWVHEGGIATPLIVHWPAGVAARGEIRRQPAQLPDLMATFLDVAGAPYPADRNGAPVRPCEGFSMLPTLRDAAHAREALFWEHEGNRAVRRGKWKLVRKFPGPWELHDMEAGQSETRDAAAQHPEVVADLSRLYDAWAARCGVRPWEEILEIRRKLAAGKRRA